MPFSGNATCHGHDNTFLSAMTKALEALKILLMMVVYSSNFTFTKHKCSKPRQKDRSFGMGLHY